MKKMLPLLIVFGTIAGAQAQSSRTYPSSGHNSRDVILGSENNNNRYENSSRFDNRYSFSAMERDRELERIDRKYDQCTRQLKKDRQLRPAEKRYQLQRLQEQRSAETRLVWQRFNSSRNTFNDDGNRRNDRRW